MTLEVRLFGSYREIAVGGRLSVEIPQGSTVADLVHCLHERVPGQLPPRPAVAVNRRHAESTQILNPSDELALIPAAAGG
jgi:molybdopterin synthase sulfur carrier subunit